MRRMSCVGLIVALVLVTASAARAQHSLWSGGGDCGCNACAPVATACDPCCPPLIPSLFRGIQNTLGCLFCCPGLNARHNIYRAALNRNDFNTCGSSLLPIYVRNRCNCGPVTSGCPHCGSTHAVEGEVIEMDEMPSEIQFEPTPATPLEPSFVPQGTTPGPEARRRPSPSQRAAAPTAPTRQAVSRDRMIRPEPSLHATRPVSASEAARRPSSASHVQRAGLLDAPRR